MIIPEAHLGCWRANHENNEWQETHQDLRGKVELKVQAAAPTLAHKLGDVPHVSRLLRRIAQLSGVGDRVAGWLLKVAIERGANHYRRWFDPNLPPDFESL